MDLNPGVWFALLSALLWGVNGVILKVGLGGVDRLVGTYITVGISAVFLLILATYRSDFHILSDVSAKSVIFLSLGGIFQYTLGRTFAYSSIQAIGSSRAYPITSSRILFSALLGVLVLGEKMGWLLAFGTILVFAGIFILTSEGSLELRGFHYALAGAIFWGISPIFIKLGLLSDVVLSNLISILSGFSAYTFIIYLKRDNRYISRNSIPFLALSSLTSFVAILSFYYALSLTPVVIVMPISNLYPLFTVFFSFIFIQRLEHVTMRVLIGSIVVILGTYLVILNV